VTKGTAEAQRETIQDLVESRVTDHKSRPL
jgi:hypothetical protein